MPETEDEFYYMPDILYCELDSLKQQLQAHDADARAAIQKGSQDQDPYNTSRFEKPLDVDDRYNQLISKVRNVITVWDELERMEYVE